MVRWCGVVVMAACVLVPSVAQARDTGRLLADRAMERTLHDPGCSASSRPVEETDAAPPATVLRRYAIFRTPPAALNGVGLVFDGQGGRVARAYLRSRAIDGVEITVVPLLDWRPSVWPAACDARLLTVVRDLAAGRDVHTRRAAERAAQHLITSNVVTRRLPPRTLLGLGIPGGIAITGALPLSGRIGLFTRVEFPPRKLSSTFAGLVPDGVTRLTARSRDTTVTATVHDNLVLLRLPHGSTPRRYEVFDTTRRTPKRLRHLTAG